MTSARAYLDYNATAPLCPEARAALIAALDVKGNASSVHADGRQARGLIEKARLDVAALVHAKPSEVVFTSGATESNTWVLNSGFDTIFVTGTEHVSVLAAAAASGARVITVPVDPLGRVSEATVLEAIGKAGSLGRALLSVQMANNETGVVQDVAALAAVARAAGLAVHTDAVQAAGRLSVDLAALNADFMSLSAHKMGGPKGAGALIVRDGLSLKPLMAGGGQERRRRGGTENIAAIAGFGAAAAAAGSQLGRVPQLRALRDRMERDILDVTPHAVVISHQAERLPNTSCVALPGTLAETLVIKLDLSGVSISAGSACSSGKVGASHVLAAMQVPQALTASAIRVSIGGATTENEIAAFLSAWSQAALQAGKAA
ncbi:MAG: aminotransferase class V-fold PLP-dependent enzyme [Hyphomicrobium sp.]